MSADPIVPTPPDGGTPLDEDEIDGLIPRHLGTRSELDEFEHRNILAAARWFAARSPKVDAMLTEGYVRAMHRRMFDKTWRWAGTFRRSEKNIGDVPWTQVPVRVRDALANAKAQLDSGTMGVDEVAVRLHQALTWIHPFANGNGRFSRLFVDELLRAHGRARFTWGTGLGVGTQREQYLRALRAADAGDFGPLMSFARS